MIRALVLMVSVLGVTALCAAQPAGQEMRPLPAAEAERRTAETRDFLTDLLWLHTDEHWHVGEWEEVIALCGRIVELDPHFIEAYTGPAWMLWSMDQDEEAIKLYRTGAAANPDSYEIPHEFGMYYYHRQKWAQAAEQFRKSVELEAPMYMQHMLPNTLERAGKKQEALAEWRALLRRFPDDPIPGPHIEVLERELAQE